MTILTLFELVIFIFYRDQNDAFKNIRPPSSSIIYNIPHNTLKTTNKQIFKRNVKNHVVPIIF